MLNIKEDLLPGDHIYVPITSTSTTKTNSRLRNNNVQHAIYVGYSGACHWVCTYSPKDEKIIQQSLCHFAKDPQLINKASYGYSSRRYLWNRLFSRTCYMDDSCDIQTVVRRALESVDSENNPWITTSEQFAFFCKTGHLIMQKSHPVNMYLTVFLCAILCLSVTLGFHRSVAMYGLLLLAILALVKLND